MSNWFGLSDRHRITTRSLLATDTSAPATAPSPDDIELSDEWRGALDDAVTDAEKTLVLALASTEVPALTLGFETDDGDVLDFAWIEAQVCVVAEEMSELAHTMTEAGWTICPPNVERIVEALTKNGCCKWPIWS